MKTSLFNQIIKEAEEAILTQNEDGSFPGGHNGPYFDPETPVRNTAHWIFTLTSIYKKNQNPKLVSVIERAVDYLKGKAARPMNATFYCRTNPKKDFTNGVIGQAWVIEALVEVAKVFNRQDCYVLAENVFLMHPWLPKLKVWRVVNVEGSYNDYDPTFNHQLWFAAAGSLLNKTPLAQERSLLFLENAFKIIKLYKNGVIYHSSPFLPFKWKPNELINKINYLNKMKPLISKDEELYKKSAGYHAFNLYAFAILKQSFPDHKGWKSSKMIKMLNACRNSAFQTMQNDNKYSYPYNPTGFELAFVFEELSEDKSFAQFWIDEQVKSTAVQNGSVMTRETDDIVTSKARLYEALRLKNNYTINKVS